MLNKQNKKLERRCANLNVKSILKINIKNMYQLKKIKLEKRRKRLGSVAPNMYMLHFFLKKIKSNDTSFVEVDDMSFVFLRFWLLWWPINQR